MGTPRLGWAPNASSAKILIINNRSLPGSVLDDDQPAVGGEEVNNRMASNEEVALVPLDQRTVEFYGDEITAVLIEDDDPQVYVPLRPICEYLGLTWQGQHDRVRRDPVLSDAMRSVSVTLTEAGARTMLCLPLEYLPGWLFGISTNRVRPELQEKITRYRRECFRVLWRAFQSEALARVEPSAPAASSSLIQIREMGLAIAQMADSQMALERRQGAVETRMDRAATVVGELQRRLSKVERRLDPAEVLTDEQASAISNRVKALAMLLTSHDNSKNHYQGIFGELYRRFRVSDYKSLKQERFNQVLEFLDEWYTTAMGSSAESSS